MEFGDAVGSMVGDSGARSLGETWCSHPGGNTVHYFGNGMELPCECGERPYFQSLYIDLDDEGPEDGI